MPARLAQLEKRTLLGMTRLEVIRNAIRLRAPPISAW
jgi:hypothetical protein